MELNTRGSGSLGEPGVMVFSHTLRVRSMKETGETTRLTVMESMFTQTALNTRVNGSKTFSMVMERRVGQMAQYSEAITERERRTDSENTSGLMEPHMRANGKITKSLDMDIINGQTGANISDIGKATLWMRSEFIHGKMAECMRVSIRMTRNMASVSIPGQTKNAMPDGGAMENNMA